jgi:hypothetical protein
MPGITETTKTLIKNNYLIDLKNKLEEQSNSSINNIAYATNSYPRSKKDEQTNK